MTIVIAILVFGFIILLHEFGHFLTARAFGVQINEFSIGFGPRLLSRKRKGTAYSLRAFPIGGFVAMEGEDAAGSGSAGDLADAREALPPRDPEATGVPFNSKPAWQRLIILAAGAIMNILLGFAVLLLLTNSMELIGTNTVAGFPENSTLTEYLQPGDRILKINGCRTNSYSDVTFQLVRDEDCVIDMTIQRGDEKKVIRVPFTYTMTEDGKRAINFDLIMLGKERNFGNSIPYSANWTVSIVRQVWYSLTDILTGRYGLNELSGPVGTAQIIGEASRMGWDTFAYIVAYITVNVGVFNLLPIPGLDGGRLLFLLIEVIRGKPVPTKYEAWVNAAGLLLMFGLIIVVTFNDIVKLFTK